MIISLSETGIETIEGIIKEISNEEGFEVNFTGGTSEPIEDIRSLIVKEKSLCYDDGRCIDVKNISNISKDGKVIFFVQ